MNKMKMTSGRPSRRGAALAARLVIAGGLLALAGCPSKGSTPTTTVGNTTVTQPPSRSSHACHGRWKDDDGTATWITITGGPDDSSCGLLNYPSCTGRLTDCEWGSGRVKGRYVCTDEDFRSAGVMTFTCSGEAMTLVDEDDDGSVFNSTLTRIER